MKSRIFHFVIFVLVGLSMTLLAQDYLHFPASHNHNTPICWGYATARAFGRDNHPVCPAYPCYLGNIPSEHFDQIAPFNINDVQAGDIIDFTKPGQQHVAYVRQKNSSTTSGIILDQVENEGGALKTGYTLQQTIDGVPGQLYARGQPVSYWCKKPKFDMVVQNKLGDNSSGGKVGFNGAEYNSPYTTPKFHWESSHTLDAVMDGRTHGGYVQRFDRWEKDGQVIAYTKVTQILINWNSGRPTFEARLLNEYDITFRNQFTGVSGYPGAIKVNGATKNSPHVEKVKDGRQVTGEAIWQVYNHIEYTFSRWSDGNTSASRTITALGHATYTASFTGKPRAMRYYNLHVSSNPGEYITLAWNQHGNSNVQYKIWRRVKPQGGSLGPETLMATLNHNVTSWTDYEYINDRKLYRRFAPI